MDTWQSQQDLDTLVPCPVQTISVTAFTSVRIKYINGIGNAVGDQKREILAQLAVFTDRSWATVRLGLGQEERVLTEVW